jgi:hypothetical protein
VKKNRIVSLFILIVFIISNINFTAYAQTISDWAKPEFQRADLAGLVPERLDSDYQTSITREEFCELVVLLCEKSLKHELPVQENPFTDTDSKYVLKAYNFNVVNGYGNGIFLPEKKIDRQEIAVMLINMISSLENDISNVLINQLESNSIFSDDKEIANWAALATQPYFNLFLLCYNKTYCYSIKYCLRFNYFIKIISN